MLKWLQGGLSAVTGIAEPEYGSDYIHTVTDRVRNKQPYREIGREDLLWIAPDHTNVETVVFYFSDLNTGVGGFIQIIHSNMIGIHTQAQCTFRIYNSHRPAELDVWTSTKLENFKTEGPNFYAENLSIELNDDNSEYHLKSSVNERSKFDLYITRLTPGCKVGDDPMTYYGDNLEEPWGRVRHVFWPRNSIRGTIDIKKKPLQRAETEEEEKEKKQEQEQGEQAEQQEAEEEEEEEGEEILEEETITFTEDAYSMFVMAFQGMKPHHAAKAWNFLYFHSKKHSAIMMEFTTPKSYANTKVTLGVLTSDTDIMSVTIDNEVEHLDSEIDSVGWSVPKSVRVDYDGVSSKLTDEEIENCQGHFDDDQKVTATLQGPLDNMVVRVDVMSEIPTFIKTIVSGVAGTKPYIYQFAVDGITLKINDEEEEHGICWFEVTFISESEVVTEESYDEA